MDYPANLNINYPSHKYSLENIAIDFIRSKLFDPCEMIILPPDKSGDINDLSEFLRMHIGEKARSKKTTIYVFGGHYSDEKGIHEVHMNQGSIGEFACSNGVYQDGCILLEYLDGHWEGIFLAFQSQSWDTNDKTGTSESNSFIYDHTNGEKICKIH